MPDPNHGDVFADGSIDGVDDVSAADRPHRAAHPERVTRVRRHRRAVDGAANRVSTTVIARAQLDHAAFIEQRRQTQLRVARIDLGFYGERCHGVEASSLQLGRCQSGSRELGLA
jgi:hypothetical protein